MPKPNPFKPYTPVAEQAALFPERSGNAVNGLDEVGFRRAKHVYWANDPDEIARGALQKWFYTVDPGLPEFGLERAKRQSVIEEPLAPLAAVRKTLSADEWTARLDELRVRSLFDMFGATAFNSNWAYEGVELDFANIIMLGFQHNYDEIRKAPEPQAGVEVMRQYTRAATAAKTVANWLRGLGWDADPLTGPMSGKITMIPPAIASGFGELGKHGSLINPEFGSSFRLSAVLTDAPIPHDSTREHGIDGFCGSCRICEDACPPEAIYPDKKTVRGETKWYVDFDKCIPFFNEHQGCAICIAECPWSRPGIGLNLARKLKRRSQRG